ncbi:MAG: CBM9 family sugar-binding protein, partial [Sedimentisphaerales bacterium]|nr:CBM9 family sugar-binding protein [Sedimentisphaerales bacterium]
MKRKTIYLTCFVLALGAPACVFAADAEIPATGSSIAIDGTRDAAWFHVPRYQIGNVVSGTSSETDCSGTWQALWSPQCLYVFVDVNDETQISDSSGKWDDDSVEVFVDIHNDKATSYAAGADDYQYRFAWDATEPEVGEDHGNTTAGIEFTLLTTGTGYALEAKFPWSILYQDAGVPSLGDLMGFEVQINDDDDGGGRDNQLDWYSTTNDAWQNPSVMGTVIFVAGRGPIAVNPTPADEATDVARDMALSWTPGTYAASHNVYFGTTFDDVNSADVGSPLLVSSGQDVNTYDPPGLLDYAQTYYWRVDEVNGPPDSTVFNGDVWSFTVEPALYPIANIVATSPLPNAEGSGGPQVTVDGTGLADGQHSVQDAAMWLGDASAGEPAWIQFDFDRLYKVYQMHVWNFNGLYEGFLGFGCKNVTIEYATEPDVWISLGDFQLEKATSKTTYAGQLIDVGGLAMRSVRINIASNFSGRTTYGLAEVQFLHKPVFARQPQPADGAQEVDPASALSWRSGREAASHQIQFGTDEAAVAAGAALVDTVTASSYSPGSLYLGTQYYWRVDEVNEAETPSVWSSDVWSFITQEYVAIDDFEGYTDDEGSLIYETWADGYEVTANGSQVGHDNPPYAEKSIVHAGRQAMPLYYTNTGAAAYSEAELAFAPPQDLSANGADVLSLYYRGVPTGFYETPSGTILMNGTGADIVDTTDQFRFAYKQLTGNGSITVRVDRIDNTHEWAKAGVMIRSGL